MKCLWLAQEDHISQVNKMESFQRKGTTMLVFANQNRVNEACSTLNHISQVKGESLQMEGHYCCVCSFLLDEVNIGA